MAYVYFVQAHQIGLVKIGYATNIDKRISELRSQSPDRLKLLGTIEHSLARSLEAELHLKFAAELEHGEWFRPAMELMAYIAKNAEPPDDAHWADVAYCDLYGAERMLGHSRRMALASVA